MVDNEIVTVIYNCYRRAMASIAGIRIKLPAHTDPLKTYAYRDIRRFIKHAQEWHLSQDLMQSLVREVVKYGKRHDILKKGTSMLSMENVLRICHDYLYNEEVKTDNLIDGIKKSKEFIDKIITTDITATLMHKEHPDGYTNFIKWFRQGAISVGYISLSINCRNAIDMLLPDEREEIPPDTVMLRNRIKILSNSTLRPVVVDIMGSDIIFTGIPNENR